MSSEAEIDAASPGKGSTPYHHRMPKVDFQSIVNSGRSHVSTAQSPKPSPRKSVKSKAASKTASKNTFTHNMSIAEMKEINKQ